MPKEFNISEVKVVRSELLEAITESEETNSKKQRLLSLLDIIINTPKLVEENRKLLAVIDRNRTILTALEDAVSQEEGVTSKRIATLQRQVFDEETRLSNTEKEVDGKIKAVVAAGEEVLTRKRQDVLDESAKIDVGVKEKRDELAKVTTEVDTARAELRAFKENVAKMKVFDM